MLPADSKLRLLVRHSAAPKDQALAEELLGHLRPLERFAGLDVWSDVRIKAGDETRREIQRAIDQADVALLLLSSDFFASDGLVEREVPRLLERHRAGQLRVIPVLLRSCLWNVHPWLRELSPLPKGGKPIGSFSGEDRDAVLTEVARKIVTLGTPAIESKTAKVSPATTPADEPPPNTGGDTYNIQIHGSTIGSFGAGTGAKVSGHTNAVPNVYSNGDLAGRSRIPPERNRTRNRQSRPTTHQDFDGTARRAVHEWLEGRIARSDVLTPSQFPCFQVVRDNGKSAWVDIMCFPSETTSATRRFRERLKSIEDFVRPQTAFAGFALVAVACSPLHALGIRAMFSRLYRETFCGLVCVSGHLNNENEFHCEDEGDFGEMFRARS